MQLFRKKPVVVEAMHVTLETEWPDVKAFCPVAIAMDYRRVLIPTLEGQMTADVGDWIIKGVRGEFYPCKPDIFEQTYEPAPTPPPPDKEGA